MRQVRRQDHERLEQRYRQHRDDHVRDGTDQLTHRPGHEHEHREGDHGCRHARHHRTHHGARARDGAGDTRIAGLVLYGDAFADDDGIVHHDPGRQHERQERHRVDGQAERFKQQHAAHEGNRDARRDPHREAQVEDQDQKREHQRDAEHGVGDHATDPDADPLAAVLPGDNVDAIREFDLGRCVHDRLRRRNHLRVPSVGFPHAEEHRRPTIDPADQGVFREAVVDGGHVAEP